MKNLTTRRLAVSGMIGAAYAVMAIFGSVFGLTFGPIQFRFSEALCVTPFLFPEAVGGLFVGCLIANLFRPYGLLDIIIGSDYWPLNRPDSPGRSWQPSGTTPARWPSARRWCATFWAFCC